MATPYQEMRQMESAVNRLGLALDFDTQTTDGRRAFDGLKRDLRQSRDMLKDYEMFELEEDLQKQVRLLPRVIKSLERSRHSLLKASEYELVGAVDVAQLSAQLDELIDRLK